MTISPPLTDLLRFTAPLLALTLWACSSASAGADEPTDGKGQHIDDPQAGSGGTAASAPGAGGTNGSAPDADGEGKGSATGVPSSGSGAKGSTPESSEAGAGAGDDQPEPEAPSEEFLRGEALVEQNECVTCHQADRKSVV